MKQNLSQWSNGGSTARFKKTNAKSFVATSRYLTNKKSSLWKERNKRVPLYKKLSISLYNNESDVYNKTETKSQGLLTRRSRQQRGDCSHYLAKRSISKSSKHNLQEASKSLYTKRKDNWKTMNNSRNPSRCSVAKNNISQSRSKLSTSWEKTTFISCLNKAKTNTKSRPTSKMRKQKNFIKSNIENINSYSETAKLRAVNEGNRSLSKTFRLKTSFWANSNKKYEGGIKENAMNKMEIVETRNQKISFKWKIIPRKSSRVNKGMPNLHFSFIYIHQNIDP